jgi:hypothetical protein
MLTKSGRQCSRLPPATPPPFPPSLAPTPAYRSPVLLLGGSLTSIGCPLVQLAMAMEAGRCEKLGSAQQHGNRGRCGRRAQERCGGSGSSGCTAGLCHSSRKGRQPPGFICTPHWALGPWKVPEKGMGWMGSPRTPVTLPLKPRSLSVAQPSCGLSL